jgi:hypothetical protein
MPFFPLPAQNGGTACPDIAAQQVVSASQCAEIGLGTVTLTPALSLNRSYPFELPL